MEACGAVAAARRLVLPSTAQGAGAWPLAGHGAARTAGPGLDLWNYYTWSLFDTYFG